MLKSCKYCGRIHDTKTICKQKQVTIKQKQRYTSKTESAAYKFRNSTRWKDKSKQIRMRDNYMCLCCKANMDNTIRQYNSQDLSVHHIIPIEDDYSLRLDSYNLITVCGVHHEMCEAGKISTEEQKRLAYQSSQMGC